MLTQRVRLREVCLLRQIRQITTRFDQIRRRLGAIAASITGRNFSRPGGRALTCLTIFIKVSHDFIQVIDIIFMASQRRDQKQALLP